MEKATHVNFWTRFRVCFEQSGNELVFPFICASICNQFDYIVYSMSECSWASCLLIKTFATNQIKRRTRKDTTTLAQRSHTVYQITHNVPPCEHLHPWLRLIFMGNPCRNPPPMCRIKLDTVCIDSHVVYGSLQFIDTMLSNFAINYGECFDFWSCSCSDWICVTYEPFSSSLSATYGPISSIRNNVFLILSISSAYCRQYSCSANMLVTYRKLFVAYVYRLPIFTRLYQLGGTHGKLMIFLDIFTQRTIKC